MTRCLQLYQRLVVIRERLENGLGYLIWLMRSWILFLPWSTMHVWLTCWHALWTLKMRLILLRKCLLNLVLVCSELFSMVVGFIMGLRWGEVVITRILELYPREASYYVLVWNLYASNGRWVLLGVFLYEARTRLINCASRVWHVSDTDIHTTCINEIFNLKDIFCL